MYMKKASYTMEKVNDEYKLIDVGILLGKHEEHN